MTRKERLMYLLALIKVDVGTSEHLYTLMNELNIDSRKVDEIRDDIERIKSLIEKNKIRRVK